MGLSESRGRCIIVFATPSLRLIPSGEKSDPPPTWRWLLMDVHLGGRAMFNRPHWRNESAYQWLLNADCDDLQIAWEFLRRNPLYSEAVVHFWCNTTGINPEAFEEYVTLHGLELKPPARQLWAQDHANRWNINEPELPSVDEGWHAFPIPSIDEYATFLPLENGHLHGPRVLLPVDLSEPLEVSFSKVQEQIRELRERGIRSGLVTPKTSRILAPALYVQYLRILDAVEAGATYEEIGASLTPDAANDPMERQRDKRTRAAHAAASKLRDEGYKALLGNAPQFVKN
jgi:hypothetical protein